MWDESLPVYDGSLEHNIIVISLYGRVAIYYVLLILGLLTTLTLLLCPFIGAYLGYKSIKIKFKEDKLHKKINKQKKKKENIDENLYLQHLDKKVHKKKKHHH